jgi:enoyl-CoA hydratase
MDYSSYRFIRAERRDRILTLTLDNPPMNTVQIELHNELSRIFNDVQVDHDSDVVILAGSGDVFSAGGDIPNMQRRIDDPELFNRKNVEMKRIVFGLIELEKPIICRINGDCMGLGATLALLCDITVAVDSARIADPHVKMGYVAGDGGAVIWPQLVGFARAKEYLLFSWLRVSSITKMPQIDHGVGHQLHTVMALLFELKAQQQPFRFILPREGPLHA